MKYSETTNRRDWYLTKPFFRLKSFCFSSAKHNTWNRWNDKARGTKKPKRPHPKHANNLLFNQRIFTSDHHLFRLKLISIKNWEKTFFCFVMFWLFVITETSVIIMTVVMDCGEISLLDFQIVHQNASALAELFFLAYQHFVSFHIFNETSWIFLCVCSWK